MCEQIMQRYFFGFVRAIARRYNGRHATAGALEGIASLRFIRIGTR